MCKPQSEGGQRCVAHTRPRYQAFIAEIDACPPGLFGRAQRERVRQRFEVDGENALNVVANHASTTGYKDIERDIDRTEILICDEAFFCGSSHELLPIVSIDDYELGDGGVGPVTAALQRLYFDVVAARRPDGMGWLTPVRPDALEPC